MVSDSDEDYRTMKGALKDWRKALRTPATYRVGNAVRVQPGVFLFLTLIACLIFLIFYYTIWTADHSMHKFTPISRQYNNTYPLTKPLVSGDVISFRIGIIADLDQESKSKSKDNVWISYLKKGYLSYNSKKQYAVVSWDQGEPTVLSSSYSLKGRGMELSELVVFDGRLLTFDDRSGMVFEIVNNKVIPWVILMDGDGHVEKGFKSEWATVRDEVLYVGSMGKEWTTASGVFQSYDPMWVKAVNINGEVQHLNWVEGYKAVRGALGISWPGYMIHECAAWSHHMQRWLFLPRRCSHAAYNETEDELMGCSYLITADQYFSDVRAKKIINEVPTLGFSSVKLIPGARDAAVVALRTLEHRGRTHTYITAFTLDGHELMPETLVADTKYEGIEFI